MHSDIHSPPSRKKEKQISFRVTPEFARQLEEWADLEEISVADLVRKLMKISTDAYRQAGSLHELKKQFGEDRSTEVPSTIDEKSYRRALRREVLTESERTAAREKAGHVKGRRLGTKPAKQQEKTPGETDHD